MVKQILRTRLASLERAKAPPAGDEQPYRRAMDAEAQRMRDLLAPYPGLLDRELPPAVQAQSRAIMRQCLALAKAQSEQTAPQD